MSEETHKRHFKGWFIPAGLIALWEMDEINDKELILLATIDSLVGPSRGCFASNKYLAERVKVQTRWLIAMLARLIDIGLVKRRERGGERELITAFHHAAKRLEMGVQKNAGGAEKCTPQVQKNAPPFSGDVVSTSLNKQVLHGGAEPRVFGVVEKTFEQEAASRLESILRKHRRVVGPIKPKVWQNAICDLLKQGRTKDEVRNAIKFLAVDEYFRGKYTPKIFSAASFKSKFDALLNAVERTEAIYAYTETLACTQDEAFILGMLNTLSWPKGSQGQLHACLRKSIEAFEPWRKEVYRLNGTEKPLSNLGLFTERLLTSVYYGGARTYLLNWFRQVNATVIKWKDWSGDLSQYEWAPRHKLHVTMLEEQSTQLSSVSKHAHALLAAIE
jgi:hypothetical protein